MAGQTESLSVPSEEPATQQAGGEGCAEEEVVASVETGEPNSNFIITAASDDSMEGGKLAKNVESEAVGVIEEEEERPAEIEDEFASNDNVAEETVEETPMETEDIPRRVEEISETAIQEESMAETNIPEEMNTEDPPKEEVENKPVSNIPDEISNKEETSSVQEQEPSKPDDNSSEVFHREEQPESATESPDPPPYSSSILKNVVESTITTEPTITTR